MILKQVNASFTRTTCGNRILPLRDLNLSWSQGIKKYLLNSIKLGNCNEPLFGLFDLDLDLANSLTFIILCFTGFYGKDQCIPVGICGCNQAGFIIVLVLGAPKHMKGNEHQPTQKHHYAKKDETTVVNCGTAFSAAHGYLFDLWFC